MAVRNIDEAKVKNVENKPKKIAKTHILIVAAILLLFGTAIGTAAVNFADTAEYNRKISELNKEASEVSVESSKIYETLKEENHAEYFEKIAREQYGYCKPGEKVYYGSAYGE